MKCFVRISLSERGLEEVERVLRKHLERGGRILHVVWDFLEAYPEHLEAHGVPYRIVELQDGEGRRVRMLFAALSGGYRAMEGVVGVANTYCLLEGESLDEAVGKFLRGDYEPIEA